MVRHPRPSRAGRGLFRRRRSENRWQELAGLLRPPKDGYDFSHVDLDDVQHRSQRAADAQKG
jgi:hypothetical protein